MALFQIHRIKQSPGEAFRWAAHTGGLAIVKQRDYEHGQELEAPSIYAAWQSLAGSEHPLAVGDMLEDPSAKLCILKYIGFEPAQWFVAEPKDGHENTSIPGQEASNLAGLAPL